MFLVWQAPAAGVAPAIERIAKHVRRIVFLSNLTVRDGIEEQAYPVTTLHAKIERLIEVSGVRWTFLRPGAFMNNTLDWAPMVRAGEVAMAYGDATQTPIDLGDIAAVAARVLTTGGHAGATYVLSGPEPISLRGQVETLASVLGKEIRFRELTPAEQRAQWIGYGVPEEAVGWLLEGFEETLRHPQAPTGVVEDLLGRPGTTYASWAAARRDVFA